MSRAATATSEDRTGSDDTRQLVATVLGAISIAFGVAIGVGVVRTLWALLGNGHPDPGWGYFTFDDALQVYLGHLPYGDPADGYTGLLYPPVFSTVVGGLLHLKFWSGWGVLVSMCSGLALVAMTARVAYRPSAALDLKPVRVLEAAAIGLLGWWLVSIIPEAGLVDSRPDTLAWALGLGGLLLLPAALSGRRRRPLILSGLLVSLAFWTKQPALAAGLAAGTYAVIQAAAGNVSRRRALAFIGALGIGNLLVLGLLSLATHGWLYFMVFTLARRHSWGLKPYDAIFDTSVDILWMPALFALLCLGAGALALWRRRTGPPPRWRALLAAPEAQRFLVLALFVAILLPMETYFQRKQGAESEHLIGVVWGLALLAAVGYRWAGADRRLALAPLAAVAAMGLAALSVGGPGDHLGGRVPRATEVHVLAEVPSGLVDVARDTPIYSPRWSDLGEDGGKITTNYTACDLVAAGVHPGALERALVQREYALVTRFPETDSVYCSGAGKWEENYFWKLNRVIDHGYVVPAGIDPATPGVVLERRGGAIDTDAFTRCFAPYAFGGALFRIGHGGGFWCRPTAGSRKLVLGDAPAPFSEVLTDGTVTAISGTLALTLPQGTGSMAVLARRTGGTTELGKLDGARRGREATLRLSFGTAVSAGSVAVDPSRLRGAQLVLAATPGSEASFDLADVRIETEGGSEVGKAGDLAREAAGG